METRQTAAAEFESAVARAQRRAAETGELRPVQRTLLTISVPDELADFAAQVLTDGTYAQAVERIGTQDPDLADA